jgi:predicted HicB family RNase H-like nuclease
MGVFMRPQLQGTPIRFRVSEAMLAKAMAKAQSEGVSLSEFVRTALRRELSQ